LSYVSSQVIEKAYPCLLTNVASVSVRIVSLIKERSSVAQSFLKVIVW
jgi:hypothetical protein